ncbi:potassium transporter TrkA [Halobacterium rubrum]|uniref:potassium transporter TrkA n=1 Tax=Halobacterium TaxID=2239 RepID=UPI001F2E606E|nr:potassium transporter TrkA [Halobacterium rubrum]MDH5019381.1 potassium transporter TrkA [Halobacterium rubrum]
MTAPPALAVGDAVPVASLAEVGGLVVAAALVVAVLAAGFRWFFRQRVAFGVALLVDATVVTLYLNTRVALGQAISGATGALEPLAVVFNLAAFAVAGVLVVPAVRFGDRIGVQVLAASGARELASDVGDFVQAVGRAIAVDLPEDVADIDGYDPVADDVKRDLAGKTLVFPRRLTVEQLEDRVAARLKDDYEVGYVDVELDADGTVTHLGLGRRVAGIGPTLPPGTAAVAVHADPPNAASTGDLVQVWATGDGNDDDDDDAPGRVATAEVRAVHGDDVTLAVDEADAEVVAGGEFRLATLPREPGADHEFAAVLRGADETMSVVDVAAGSDLDGATVADAPGAVVAVRSNGRVEAIPDASRALVAGDAVYALASPEAARRLEAAGAAPPGADSTPADDADAP